MQGGAQMQDMAAQPECLPPNLPASELHADQLHAADAAPAPGQAADGSTAAAAADQPSADAVQSLLGLSEEHLGGAPPSQQPPKLRLDGAAPGAAPVTPDVVFLGVLPSVQQAVDDAHAQAAAALAAAAASEDPALAGGSGLPRVRGRPRKRRPVGEAGDPSGPLGQPTACVHCGTGETPRWWKDISPDGVLCNACGIWLKRHGYSRPVQFFVSGGPGEPVAVGPPGVQRGGAAAAQQQPAARAEAAGADDRDAGLEYYLINGRPRAKRRRGGGAAGGAPARPPPAAEPAGEAGEPADQPINFEAAGSHAFVLRRQMRKGEAGAPDAAVVQFGWAPSSRAAHEMFGRVAAFAQRNDTVQVDDFELLGDRRASAVLMLRPGVPPPASWDALVLQFVGSL